jgi:flagellar hook-associated protein 3 FlgL
MRIATSTIYAQQTQAIDNQVSLYAGYANQLSTGKSLNAPSDDPTQIAQDLQVHISIDTTTQQSTNVQSAVNELTQTDSALSSLTAALQSARTLAVQGANGSLGQSQRTAIGVQVDQLLQQAISIANTQYAGKYIFAGTSTTANPPVVAQGNPISGVQFTGNEQDQGQLVYNNQQFALSTTFQSAFNYNATNGSPDVFQTLVTLRNTLNNSTVVDESTAPINAAGQVVSGTTPVAAASTAFGTTPAPDNSAAPGNYDIAINGVTIAVPSGTTMNALVTAINAQTATTGVTATFNPQTEKISLSGTKAFTVQDVPAAGATTAGNLTSVLKLDSNANAGNADTVQYLSTQLGDIDNVLNTVLNARSIVGSRIQTLSSIGSQLQSSITDNTKVKSNIEDTNVAAVTAKYSQTQVALQAAYQTTNSLESKTLMNYMTTL